MQIALNHVTKRYGATVALDDVSLHLNSQRIVSVLGINGAGKSTLLRILSGITCPSSGEVLYNDEPFTRQRLDLRRLIGFLPDSPPVAPNSTVIQYISTYVGLYDCFRSGIEAETVQLLTQFDLLPLADQAMPNLSRGQAYKVALCALILVDPEVWFLDEPFASGMDPKGHSAFRRAVNKAVGQGRTVVYSTQIVELAETFSDEVVILDRAQLKTHSPMADLRQRAGSGERTLERLLQEMGPRA